MAIVKSGDNVIFNTSTGVNTITDNSMTSGNITIAENTYTVTSDWTFRDPGVFSIDEDAIETPEDAIRALKLLLRQCQHITFTEDEVEGCEDLIALNSKRISYLSPTQIAQIKAKGIKIK